MEMTKEKNRIALERISFHLDAAMSFCHELDLSGLGPLEQEEWINRVKTCNDAIIFTRQSVQKLREVLE